MCKPLNTSLANSLSGMGWDRERSRQVPLELLPGSISKKSWCEARITCSPNVGANQHKHVLDWFGKSGTFYCCIDGTTVFRKNTNISCTHTLLVPFQKQCQQIEHYWIVHSDSPSSQRIVDVRITNQGFSPGSTVCPPIRKGHERAEQLKNIIYGRLKAPLPGIWLFAMICLFSLWYVVYLAYGLGAGW